MCCWYNLLEMKKYLPEIIAVTLVSFLLCQSPWTGTFSFGIRLQICKIQEIIRNQVIKQDLIMTIKATLEELIPMDPDARVTLRIEKYSKMGKFHETAQ